MALRKEAGGSQEPSPLIPFDTLDAPSQRLYVLGFYTALFFWRLYDFYNLTVDETESLWLFMKWVAIDGVFLFGLPGLKIPWLEWSSATMTVIFLLHAFLDGVLMFRIPIPLGAGVVALTKVLYDRELSVSERRVKVADILHNSSLILGKQIIHILPEGSALLNPSDIPLCLDSTKTSIDLHLQINQSVPILMELLRFDLETGDNETITISASQLKKMRKTAEKAGHKPSDPIRMKYTVKKTGLYRLQRVLDATNLEVQHRRSADALVVACPKAHAHSLSTDRCLGALSDLSLVVEGTPPLKVRYKRSFKDKPTEISYQGIQPEDYGTPPLAGSTLILHNLNDIQWAKSRVVRVPLNETLTESGHYSYSILAVTDALGNVINYDEGNAKSKPSSLLVHERPRAAMHGSSAQLQVAKGRSAVLPIIYSSTAHGGFAIKDTLHKLTYRFSPQLDDLPVGEHGENSEIKEVVIKTTQETTLIQDPGLYTLLQVSTPFCQGDILEPASCNLVNPPQPNLSVGTDLISDKCAGNPIGLRIGIDFVGTPPFLIKYTEYKEGDPHAFAKTREFKGLRGQMEFRPAVHGRYTLTITEIGDSVYGVLPLAKNSLVFQQDIKPSVSARFVNLQPDLRACFDDTAQFDVELGGEGPWNLEYELIHEGKRSKYAINDIKESRYKIITDKLTDGGDHSIVLGTVADRFGCKEMLQEEAKVKVRRQRSKASFGILEGKRAIQMLQGKPSKIPLRLSGEAPWTIDYRIPGDAPDHVRQQRVLNQNGEITVSQAGSYEIVAVRDAHCPGTVEDTTNRFEVTYIDRPRVVVATNPEGVSDGDKHSRKEVCEGDEDAVDITFGGKPPFTVKCREAAKPDRGPKYTRNLDLVVPQQSSHVKMDTAHAGTYEYVFSELQDGNYGPESKQPILIVKQKVNPRPTAQFSSPGKTYSFCQGEQDGGEEVIPITLTGQPPFTLDVEIKQNKRSSKPEPISIAAINSLTYDLRVPHRYLLPGTSILSIRKVRDARGCDRFPDITNSPRVQISVNQPPSISDLEELRTDYCVGDRINYALSGLAPFTVFYTFAGASRKAAVPGTTFRRIAESPGNFTVTGVADAASACRAQANLAKIIHPMPSVRVSQGQERRVDIHAGSEAEIVFEFGGTPPFEFTYTRSENARKGGGGAGRVLETKTMLTNEHVLRIRAGEEGTYEVVAIKDRFCAYAREDYRAGGGKSGQKLLQN